MPAYNIQFPATRLQMPEGVSRLFDIMRVQAEQFPLARAVALASPAITRSYSSREFLEASERLASWGLRQSFQPGDRFAIVSRNCPQWSITDHALLRIGMVNVPLYPTLSPHEYEYILREAEVKVIFVGDAEIWSNLKPAVQKLSIPHVIALEPIEDLPRWDDLIQQTLPTSDEQERIRQREESVQPEDLATIIYTSGTTGEPKGVMLSHANILANVRDCVPLIPVERGSPVLSFLPLNHSFERAMMYIYQAGGLSIYFVNNLDFLMPAIQEVRPALFATVPRLLEKVYERILQKGMELPPLKRALFFWALSLARRWNPEEDTPWSLRLRHRIADRLVFARWREALGGRLVALISGGAALREDLARIFWCAGIPVMEGYGLTETSPVISVNRLEPDGYKIGTTGPPLPSVEVRIAEDGEVLVRGPNVMLGYYQKPDQTAEIMDPDGWLHTGDIGELVPGKKYHFLKITDRKKELLKTAGGKYIAPQPIENKLKASLLVENAMVLGEGKKFPAVLLVPDEQNLQGWAKREKITFSSTEDLLRHPRVIERFRRIIQNVNAGLSKPEQIKRFAFVRDHWSQETGELTPTLKLKRRVLLQRYASLIEALYNRTEGWDVYPEESS